MSSSDKMEIRNNPNAVPGIFLRVIQILEEEKAPIVWKLSKTHTGKTFL